MKIFLLSTLCVVIRVKANDIDEPKNGIGSVLLNQNSQYCQENEESMTLNYRKKYQDVLFKMQCSNCEDDRFIALAMDNFKTCFSSIRDELKNETKLLMKKTLADVMGGYLRVYILPSVKHCYYAGNVKYHNVKKIFDLFDDLKKFLHTNGDGWGEPKFSQTNAKTSPLVITLLENQMNCDGLIEYVIGQPSRNSTCDERVIIPLPFLDDNENPNSIALPFATDNLQSLYAEKSAFVLVKYYVASVKCLHYRSKSKNEVTEFQRDFFDWLKQTIYPLLEKDKWYPAFGGVLRVGYSLEEAGIRESYVKNISKRTTPNATLSAHVLFNKTTDSRRKKEEKISFYSLGTVELIIIATTCALLIWLLIGLTIVCCRFIRNRYKSSS